MPNATIYNMQGQEVGEYTFNDAVFAIQPSEASVHTVITAYLANQRQGTQSALTRAEVRGGGKKPWRQKGTGRARHGTSRSPIWRGGGIVFGPHPRSYKYSLPKKVRRLALRSALSSKVHTENILIVDELLMEQPKTKEMARILGNLKVDEALLVTTGDSPAVAKSARNIPGVKPLEVDGINVYDILAHEKLVITKDAVVRVEEVLAP